MNTTGTKQYWSMTEGVFNCLIDEKRTSAFIRAIKKTVRKGDIVVDMGTGSGVLAIAAAKAGAKKVYAIEYDKNNIKTLESTFKASGVADTVYVINSDIREVTLSEKVDVVIGEMIATALVEELQVAAMNRILNYAKKGVRVLLNKYKTTIDVVHNNDHFYGSQFKVLRYEYPDESKLKSTAFTKGEVVATYNFSKKITNHKVNKSIELSITKTGLINGIRLRGETTFWDGSKLGATFAYDYPLVLPIPDTHVKRGQKVKIKLKYEVGAGLESLKYQLIIP